MCRDRAPQANIDDVSISIAEIEKAPSRLLREGRCANARVTEVAVDGRKWVVKDFSCVPIISICCGEVLVLCLSRKHCMNLPMLVRN